MDSVISWKGDSFEDGILGPRNKYIHSVGSVAKVKFVSANNTEGYTGIFEGADHGYVRISGAAEPDTSKTTAAEANGNFRPGSAFKFLRDGIPLLSYVFS